MSADLPVEESVRVELPIGFLHEGKLLTSAEIVPMTGRVRKVIARPEVRQNPARVIDTLLMECVRSVGTLGRPKKSLIEAMFLGDRDFLIMEIRRISLGKDVHSTLTCDSCNEKMSMTVDLTRDVPVKKLKEIEYTIEGNKVVFTLKDPVLKIDAKFCLPTGAHQNSVANLYRKNPIEANYALYQSCLIEWNGTPSSELVPNFFDSQPLPVIDFIDENFMATLPGPDMRVPVNCVACNNEMTVTMESSDFLFRLPKREKT